MRRGVLLLAKYLAVATFALGIILLVCAIAFVASAGFSAIAEYELVLGDLAKSLWLLTCVTVIGTISGAAVASALADPVVAKFVSGLPKKIVFVDDMQGIYDRADEAEWQKAKKMLVERFETKDPTFATS